ncbi:hypothetical protein AB0K60_35635 [Thermopolyspora sp. NPDC052614]|uniref:hypothetical protein n=1 Tax=Thermopolyspora sp. NPDC052614 TaxID=3155682 RepID=UPI003412AB09
MLKRALAAAVVAAPAFLVTGTIGAQPAGAVVSAPCATIEKGTPRSADTSQQRCRWRYRYGRYCKECYRYGSWRVEYCRDRYRDY